jgi:hypothetical protein
MGEYRGFAASACTSNNNGEWMGLLVHSSVLIWAATHKS